MNIPNLNPKIKAAGRYILNSLYCRPRPLKHADLLKRYNDLNREDGTKNLNDAIRLLIKLDAIKMESRKKEKQYRPGKMTPDYRFAVRAIFLEEEPPKSAHERMAAMSGHDKDKRAAQHRQKQEETKNAARYLFEYIHGNGGKVEKRVLCEKTENAQDGINRLLILKLIEPHHKRTYGNKIERYRIREPETHSEYLRLSDAKIGKID